MRAVEKPTIGAIIACIPELSKFRCKFLEYILTMFLSIKGRINFLQLQRYGRYSEHNNRIQFEQFIDFGAINSAYIKVHGSGHYVLAFDCSYISKSGKSTSGIGKYWSGKSQAMEWGLEAGLLSVIDINHHTAFHIDVAQTPASAERQDKQISLVDHYAQVIGWNTPHLQGLVSHLAVDAYFAKTEFVHRILTQCGLHIISRLRKDANLQYLYKGPKKAGKGAPRKYDGKIDIQNPDLSRFELLLENEQMRLYSAIVYCRFLKRNIKLAYTQYFGDKQKVKSVKLYFSTDLDLNAHTLVKYYQARFQQEFLIRDAKQFTGLEHSQARSINKLEYHWNMALTAINVAKAEHWLAQAEATSQRIPFSMSDIKTLYHNQLLLDSFFDILPEGTQLSKNDPKVRQLYNFGIKAA